MSPLSRRRRFTTIAVAALLVGVVAAALVHSRGGGRVAPAAYEPAMRNLPTVSGGAPVRSAEHAARGRSPEGAARIAARFLTDLGSGENARSPERVDNVLRSRATVELRQMRQQFVDGLRALAARLDPNGGTPLLRTAPLGYRVEAYNGRAARIAIWKVVIAGTHAGRVLAVFDTTRLTLRWTARGWRVTAFGADVPGPTPHLPQSSQTAPTESAVLATVVEGFLELRP